jgi:VWFA-related protein
MTARHIAVTLISALTLVASHSAAQPTPDIDRPTFRATTALVQFEAVVTDRSGRPLEGLTADDFDVRQDGVPVPVRLVTFVSGTSPAMRPTRASAPTQAPASAAPPTLEARDIVVVIDERNMTFDSHTRAKEALQAFVDDMMTTSDRVLLVSTAPDRELVLSFESNRDVLRAQLGAFTWDATFRGPGAGEFAARECTTTGLLPTLALDVLPAVGSFGVLSELLTHLRARPGRKLLVWLTDGLVPPLCTDTTWALAERIRRLTDLANRSGVVVYGVQTLQWSSGAIMPTSRGPAWAVSGPVPQRPARQMRDEHLRHVADRTGGLVTRSNDIDASLREALDDSRSYYLLAYEPPVGTFTDRFEYRDLAVTVKRYGAQVRTRSGFYSVSDDSLSTR